MTTTMTASNNTSVAGDDSIAAHPKAVTGKNQVRQPRLHYLDKSEQHPSKHASKHPVHKPQDAANDNMGLAVVFKMIFSAAGIYVCFFVWGLLQERLTTTEYVINGEKTRFRVTFFISAFGALCSSLSGLGAFLVQRALHRAHWTRVPLKQLVPVGFTLAFGPSLSYIAMRHISYPMVLTVKMCKMVPIVFVGVLWHRRQFPALKYLSTLCITLGVVAFSLLGEGGKGGDATSSLLGIGLCFLNLIMDGFTNSTQDIIINGAHGSLCSFQLMFMSNLACCLWGVTAMLGAELVPASVGVTAELSQVIPLLLQSHELCRDLVLFGVAGAFGQLFIFQALGTFGSLSVVAMTISRKVGSVVLSIVFHNHTVLPAQWLALVAVLGGVVIDTVANVRSKKAAAQKKKLQ